MNRETFKTAENKLFQVFSSCTDIGRQSRGFHNSEWAKGGGFGKHLLKGWAATCPLTSCILPCAFGKAERAACTFWSGTCALPEVEPRAVGSCSDSSQHFTCSCVPLTVATRSGTRSTFVSSEAFLSNVYQLQYLLTSAQNPFSWNKDMKRGNGSSAITHFMFIQLLSKWN